MDSKIDYIKLLEEKEEIIRERDNLIDILKKSNKELRDKIKCLSDRCESLVKLASVEESEEIVPIVIARSCIRGVTLSFLKQFCSKRKIKGFSGLKRKDLEDMLVSKGYLIIDEDE